MNRLQPPLSPRPDPGYREDVVGQSQDMVQVFAAMDRAASTESPVLILGPTGSGKEVVARAIHRGGPRRGRPMLAVNCAAVAPTLFESELFGNRKGAFTGATTDRQGIFREADGSTLLLDEIGELPLPIQAKLLRVLDHGEVRPLGIDRPVPVDVRVIAATNRDLPRAVEQSTFRADLYYRLSTFEIRLPALAERREDIRVLAERFLQTLAAENGLSAPELTEDAVRLLDAQPWPGNVRELQNTLERAAMYADDSRIAAADLLRAGLQPLAAGPPAAGFLEEAEYLALRRAAGAAPDGRGKVTAMSKILGCSRKKVYALIRKYGVEIGGRAADG